ncbi:Enzyme involved in the deoxyxylulose pathway of isoprenoid biosynthesis [Methylophaga frappieri]|uniref:Enzyme involved in the deoxyxylulose pathway of isoprenoid biosynthesis n=1 Tax=Methylophaga frappieri (strain ATCC BAA-2434 / DSM 25690 / JAM7) TaxID=754477 RepID=I1YLG1_METFJ|nr:DUF3108 domain-containing protein [Methylophaga frappieri]AFJ03754.1 Enzyme involved in the deoxyxylulose pathway of isoprenoid biosynthesis [Methylophaga frappieri]
MMLWLSCLWIWIAASPVLADSTPMDYQANYQVELNGIQAGELEQTLTTDEASNRQLVTRTQAKGVFAFFKPDIITETSIWQQVDGQIKPQFYRYQRQGGKKDKLLTMSFDWSTAIVHIDDREHPWELALQSDTLDKHVYQLQLMRDLAADRQSLQYTIADGGKLKQYEITRQATEVIETPLGHIEAIRLSRDRDPDSERQTTLWCAPALGYLPVKLEHIEKDDSRFTAHIRKLDGLPVSAFQTPQPKSTP